MAETHQIPLHILSGMKFHDQCIVSRLRPIRTHHEEFDDCQMITSPPSPAAVNEDNQWLYSRQVNTTSTKKQRKTKTEATGKRKKVEESPKPLLKKSRRAEKSGVPCAILERRFIKRGDRGVVKVRIQWSNLSPECSTWEDYAQMEKLYPGFDP